MTGFTSIAGYSPWLVLVVGGFTAAGILGLGNRIGSLLRLPQPWSSVVGALAAIELITLAVESLAIAHIATRALLIVVWAGFSAGGSLLLLLDRRWPEPAMLRSIPMAATAIILGVNLLIAICPSSKGDEIYYHMIVPARIVQDGGLLFYRQPIIAAILPQMAFQIGFAPFHALRVPDAGNVVSWFFGALLVWFAFRVVEVWSGSRRWAAFFAAVIVAGLYTSVWHVTSGAHAIGDLAVTAAVVALYAAETIASAAGPARAAIAIGILVAAAVSTKVLLLPFGGAVVLLAFVRLGRISGVNRAAIAAALVIPAIVFLMPLMTWTAVHAGSPFGPLMEGLTGPSPYQPNEVRAFVDDYMAGPRGPIVEKLRNEAVNYSPLIWLAVAVFAFGRGAGPVSPVMGIGLLLIQIVVILGWNTFDARYLGGVHYALLLLTGMFLSVEWRERLLGSRRMVAAAACLIVPWMFLQVAYARAFLPFVAGLQSPAQFGSRYIAFFDDFTALDRILPRSAVLLSYPFSINSYYAPRPIFYDAADLPRQGTVYLLTFNAWFEKDPPPYCPKGFRLGALVYENRQAVVAAHRVFGRTPRIGIVRVWKIERNDSAI